MPKDKTTEVAHPPQTVEATANAEQAAEQSAEESTTATHKVKLSRWRKKPKLSKREKREKFEEDYPWVLDIRPTEEESRWAKVVYWFFVVLRVYRWPDIFQYRTYNRSSEHAGNVQSMVAKLRKYSAGIITVTVGKGGQAKTTIATYIAAILNSCHGMNTWLCDIDPNGTRAALRFGLEDVPTLTINEITEWVMKKSQLGRVILTSQWFIDHLSTDELSNNLFVSKSDVIVDNDENKNKMITARAIETTLEAGRLDMHTTVVDCGPSVGHGVTHGAINSSEVRIIVSRGVTGETLSDIDTALSNDRWGLRSEEHEESVLVVINELPRRMCNIRTQYQIARRLNIVPHKVMFVPYDRYLGNTERVAWRKLKIPTRNAMFDVAKEATDIIVASNQRKTVPDAEASIYVVRQPAHDQSTNSQE